MLKNSKVETSLKADEIDITDDYPVYGGNGLRGYTSTYNHDGEYALIGRQGALCGNMNYSAGKAYFTEHAVVVKADETMITRFLYYMLNIMNLGQYSDQSAQPGLAVNKLVKLENSFPKKEEQQQIGAYFRSLDHLITLHQRKPIPHPNHPTIHTKHKGEEKYVRIRVNDRGKINRTANLRRFPVDIPEDLKTEEDLWANFRYILEQNNKDRLNGEGLSDSEFEQVKNQLLVFFI